jgi:hypothetical protein
MSSVTGQGSGSKADDWFAAISKQLVAMDDRLRFVEGWLHNIDTIQAKVSSLEEPIGNWAPSRTHCRRPSSALTWRRLNSLPTRNAALHRPTIHLTADHNTSAAVGNETTRTTRVTTSCPQRISSSFPSMTAPVIRCHGLTCVNSTFASAARRKRSASH